MSAPADRRDAIHITEDNRALALATFDQVERAQWLRGAHIMGKPAPGHQEADAEARRLLAKLLGAPACRPLCSYYEILLDALWPDEDAL